MGALMIALGLVASLLSNNVTVGFILGALFNAIPVFAGLIGQVFAPQTRRTVEDLSIPEQFRDFGDGVIAWSNVFYFLSLAAAMLYLNMVLLGRRHWAGGERSQGLVGHSLVRVASLVVALIGLNVLINRAGSRTDTSVEQISTLGAESKAAIAAIPSDKPVYIQAYYSAEVPREYVTTKATLLEQAPRVRGARGRQDPPQPGRDRPVLARRPRRAEAVRDRAEAGHLDRGSPPVGLGDLPGRRVHVGPGRGGRPLLRPRLADRVRDHAVDPRRVADGAEKGGHAGDRRQDARRV